MKKKIPVPIIDERENLPSASGMERLYLCRGSFNLESQLTDIADKTFADSGTRIHNALAGLSEADLLNEDERWVYDRCKEHEIALTESVFAPEKLDSLEIWREKREWMYSEEDEKQSSGELDLVYFDQDGLEALVDDYKTGYKPVTEPDRNVQLRMYAVLTAERYGAQKVTVAVIQPRCSPPTAQAIYEKEDLEYAGKELRVVLAESKDPNAPRTPGAVQCEYCKAKGICPELKKQMKSDMVQVKGITLITGKELDYRENFMPGYILSELLDKVAHVERACKAIREEAKIRIKHGRDVPGYNLVKGRTQRMITSPYVMYDKIVNRLKWMSPKDFWNNYVKISIGDIDKLAKKHPPKRLDITPERLFAQRFGTMIESRSTDLVLERTSYAKGLPEHSEPVEVEETQQILPMNSIPRNTTLEQLFGKKEHAKKERKVRVNGRG